MIHERASPDRFLRNQLGIQVHKRLRQVAAEESVQCPDDLLLRRTNWAATEPDLAPLRVAAAHSPPDAPAAGQPPL